MRSKASVADIDYATSALIDEAVEGLERSWRTSGSADLAKFALPEHHPTGPRVLVELVKVDQEYRWRSGQPKRVEQYLAEWPRVREDAGLVVELVEAECWTRAVLDSAPTVEEIHNRFPGLCEQIDLAAVQADAERERVRSGSTGKSQAVLDTPATTAAYTPSHGQPWMPLTVGQRLGRYEIRAILGSGGMGNVYRAYDTHLQREAALKAPRFDATSEPVLSERFIREARAAAKIRHPYICPIYDAGEIEGVHYIAMALIEGPSLAEWQKRHELNHAEAAALVRKLARALEAVHAAGIIHRDIKPSNVMLDETGEPLLMDFGLAGQTRGESPLVNAAALPGARSTHLTHTGAFLGTPAYMSPEQASGTVADASSDIYSLGALFYELLTGRPPVQFEGPVSPMRILESIRNVQPPPPSSLRPGLDRRLESICLKAMAKNPGERYQSAGEMAEALDRYDQALRRAASVASIRRRLTRIVAVAAGTLFLLAGVAIYVKTGNGTLEIHLKHQDQDAVVEIDGERIEVTGADFKVAVGVGGHHLEVRKDGRIPYLESFSVRFRGNEVRKTVTLERALKPPPSQWWIETAPSISAICLSRQGTSLYVAYWEDDNKSRIEVFNTLSGLFDQKATDAVKFRNKHTHGGVAVSLDGRYLFTTNYYMDYISRIDLHSSDARTDLKIGGVADSVWAEGIGITPDGRKLAVTLGVDGRSEPLDNDQVSIVDVAAGGFTLAGEVRLADEPVPHCLAFSSDSNFVYVVTRRRKSPGPTVYEIGLTPPYRVSRSLSIPGSDLRGIAVSSKLQRAFVSDAGQNKVLVIDLKTFKQASSFEIGGHSPGRLALDSPEKFLVVIAPDSRKALFLDPNDGTSLASVPGLGENAHDLAFSPDHRFLFVAHRSRDGGVAVIDLDSLRTASFSTRSGIVFSSNRGGKSHQVYVMNENGESPARLTQSEAQDLCPRWSPDGSSIAFISNRAGSPMIYVMDRRGKVLSAVANTYPVMGGGSLDWSADGREIVFVGNENRSIRVADTTTGKVRTLLDEGIAPGYSHHVNVSWKRPNAGILVSSQSPASGDYKDIFLIDPKGKNIQQLTHETGARPCSAAAWSPDGKNLAFIRHRGGGSALRDLVVRAADGTSERVLHSDSEGDSSTLSWSSNGKRLVFSARKKNRDHIYAMVLDGNAGPKQMTEGDWDDIHPDCSRAPSPSPASENEIRQVEEGSK